VIVRDFRDFWIARKRDLLGSLSALRGLIPWNFSSREALRELPDLSALPDYRPFCLSIINMADNPAA
jgi:hypothetical protein